MFETQNVYRKNSCRNQKERERSCFFQNGSQLYNAETANRWGSPETNSDRSSAPSISNARIATQNYKHAIKRNTHWHACMPSACRRREELQFFLLLFSKLRGAAGWWSDGPGKNSILVLSCAPMYARVKRRRCPITWLQSNSSFFNSSLVTWLWLEIIMSRGLYMMD